MKIFWVFISFIPIITFTIGMYYQFIPDDNPEANSWFLIGITLLLFKIIYGDKKL